MTTATIPRLTTPPGDDTMANLDQDLFRRAEAVLGYKQGAREVSAAAANRALFQRLIDIGVPPLDPKAVARHQAKAEAVQWLKPTGWMCLLAALFAADVYGMARFGDSFWPIAAIVVGGIAALAGSITAWVWHSPVNWEWRQRDLRNYPQPVPQHVLALALQVSGAIGGCGFAVEEFSYEQRQADPFLMVICHDGSRAYIAAWDEPSFKG